MGSRVDQPQRKGNLSSKQQSRREFVFGWCSERVPFTPGIRGQQGIVGSATGVGLVSTALPGACSDLMDPRFCQWLCYYYLDDMSTRVTEIKHLQLKNTVIEKFITFDFRPCVTIFFSAPASCVESQKGFIIECMASREQKSGAQDRSPMPLCELDVLCASWMKKWILNEIMYTID